MVCNIFIYPATYLGPALPKMDGKEIGWPLRALTGVFANTIWAIKFMDI